MSEQETQAVESQESQPADDAELQELQQAVQEAGLEGATVTEDGEDGFKIALRPNGGEIYPQSLVIYVSRNVNPEVKLPPGFMVQQLRELEANARLYATGKHPEQEWNQPAGGEGATQAADADAATVITVKHLHAAQALPEVGPDADVVPDCVYEGIEMFKAEDRRTMRVVLVRDLGLAAQEVPEQPAEEA